MPFALKNYQQNALAALEVFFTHARGTTTESQTATAFARARREALGESAPRVTYRRFSAALPEVPSTCLRIPTGGGKTLLAAHALERAARLYVGTQFPVALWLVPSTIIRIQTLQALTTPGHPYREALESYFPPDRLRVLTLEDGDQLLADDFGGRAIVIVATLQSLKVTNTTGRKVYAYREAFEPHFARMVAERPPPYMERVSEADLAEQPYLKVADVGRVKFSLANLLAFRRPIVLVDEAHNANTPLSTETLVRIRPACVIEWTATPAAEQNVLYTVSAQELKAEHMIKLPIVLSPRPNWQEAVADAVRRRELLAQEAIRESDYIRPLVLFQADAKDGPVPVDTLKSYLVDSLHIDARRIAVATGAQRELDGINLFERSCPIDFIITVEALKEGWDCSFAYVFCTVQNIRSAKDMEQLLGRVLRLPYAAPRVSEHLNRAYAQVSAPATVETANRLADRLINMGFEEFDAVAAVEPAPDLFPMSGTSPTPASFTSTVLQAPATATDALTALISPGRFEVSRKDDRVTVVVTGVLSADTIDAAVSAMPPRERAAFAHDLRQHQAWALKAQSPRDLGAHFAPVPRLALPIQGELALFEPALLSEIGDFSLAGCDARITGFQPEVDAAPYLIDIERGRIHVVNDSHLAQLDLNIAAEGVRREDVVRALDRRLQRTDFLQADLIAWLGRAMDELERQRVELTYLARHLNRVTDALRAKIEMLVQEFRRRTFQTTLALSDPAERPRLDPQFDFRFPEGNYPARWYYGGRYIFQKHFTGPPGELLDDNDAEETACAIAIDQLPEVRHWLRNLERHPEASFWLPTSTDRFYPDFVAELTDGRMLVVEYKGADRYSNDDSREKRDIGAVWAARSDGRCRFVMVTAPAAAQGRSVPDQLRAALR